MATPETIDMGELVTAAVHLAQQAGQTIVKVHESGALGTQLKGVDDPVTEADLAAQRLIITGLRKLWPSLAIVGEESEYPQPDAVTPLPPTATGLFPREAVPAALAHAPLSEVAVFVDPLDATREFTRGNLEPVMVLIGVTLCGAPVAGVTHQPFVDRASGGRTLYAIVGGPAAPLVRAVHARGGWPHDAVLAASTSQDPQERAEVARLLGATRTELIGGCANKMLHVLLGLADVFAMRGKGSKVWDTCAPHALLLWAGGRVTDAKGGELCYSAAPGAPVSNGRGVVVTMANHAEVIASLNRLC